MAQQLFPTTSFATLAQSLSEPFAPFDDEAADAARQHQQHLTKPLGALGRLEDIAIFMAGWQGTSMPRAEHTQIIVFAGNHGVCAQGVNVYPQDVTQQMVANFCAGGAAINQLADLCNARVKIVPLELDHPTADITMTNAMSEEETLDALAVGYGAVDREADILVLGEMGIGNTTVAAALATAIFGGSPADWVGPGTGADAEGLARKKAAVKAACARLDKSAHEPSDPATPLHILAAVGGREQAALIGACLAAREARIPLLLDGFIVTASLSVLAAAGAKLTPSQNLLAHCLAGHVGAEPGHAPLLRKLNLNPILDLGMCLGEGSGAALALPIIKAAIATHTGMSTFAQASVSDRDAPR
ncbi:MAG: nicotinate-nucleotide--dimethylbenzimidazole phosphoribosyltransferase [Pseudomonadota bacterium]